MCLTLPSPSAAVRSLPGDLRLRPSGFTFPPPLIRSWLREFRTHAELAFDGPFAIQGIDVSRLLEAEIRRGNEVCFRQRIDPCDHQKRGDMRGDHAHDDPRYLSPAQRVRVL